MDYSSFIIHVNLTHTQLYHLKTLLTVLVVWSISSWHYFCTFSIRSFLRLFTWNEYYLYKVLAYWIFLNQHPNVRVSLFPFTGFYIFLLFNLCVGLILTLYRSSNYVLWISLRTTHRLCHLGGLSLHGLWGICSPRL